MRQARQAVETLDASVNEERDHVGLRHPQRDPRLRREGHGHLTIARALKVSRNAVRRVLKSGEAKVPALQRATQVDPHIETLRALHTSCEGNMIRVQEELERAGHPIPDPR